MDVELGGRLTTGETVTDWRRRGAGHRTWTSPWRRTRTASWTASSSGWGSGGPAGVADRVAPLSGRRAAWPSGAAWPVARRHPWHSVRERGGAPVVALSFLMPTTATLGKLPRPEVHCEGHLLR